MKQVLFIVLVALAMCFMGCSSSERNQEHNSNVKAKLEIQDIQAGADLHYGDIIFRFVDEMYNIGDHIRIDGRDCVIKSMQRPLQAMADSDRVDYELVLHNDTTWVYDGNRFVGKLIDPVHSSKLDSLIEEDNR